MLEAGTELHTELSKARDQYDQSERTRESKRLQESLDRHITEAWIPFADKIATRAPTQQEVSSDTSIVPYTSERDVNLYSGWGTIDTDVSEDETNAFLQANIEMTCDEEDDTQIKSITVLIRLSDKEREDCFTKAQRAIVVTCPHYPAPDEDESPVRGEILVNPVDGNDRVKYPRPDSGEEWDSLLSSLKQLQEADFPTE